MGEEGDHVMLGDALDLVDARDIEGGVAALFPDLGGGGLRHDAEIGQLVGGMRLDLEPDAEAVLRLPDGDHIGAGITGGLFLMGMFGGGLSFESLRMRPTELLPPLGPVASW
jgi:hypothetical protein